MPQRTLRFKIRQDGRVEETVEGIVGESCLQLTEKLEESLGVVERRTATSEAFLSPCKQEQQLMSTEVH